MKFDLDPDVVSLSEAQHWLKELLTEGADCPCCHQFAKKYRRKLNSSMARGLIWLVCEAGPERAWVEYSKVGPQWLQKIGGTLATLEHWRLIESRENTETAKRASGIWRPTMIGREFALGKWMLPKYAIIYNNRCERLDGEEFGIWDALGSDFDYEALMAGT